MTYTFTGPIDRQLFYQFIMKLQKSVLRLKGYVSFRDQPNAIYEFQYAYSFTRLWNNWHAITINDCYYW